MRNGSHYRSLSKSVTLSRPWFRQTDAAMGGQMSTRGALRSKKSGEAALGYLWGKALFSSSEKGRDGTPDVEGDTRKPGLLRED